MVKKKTKVYEDRKGRYIKLNGRKYYLKSKAGLTELELIKYIINKFTKKRKRVVKKKEDNNFKLIKTQGGLSYSIGSVNGSSPEVRILESKVKDVVKRLEYAEKEYKREERALLKSGVDVKDHRHDHEMIDVKTASGVKKIPKAIFDAFKPELNEIERRYIDLSKRNNDLVDENNMLIKDGNAEKKRADYERKRANNEKKNVDDAKKVADDAKKEANDAMKATIDAKKEANDAMKATIDAKSKIKEMLYKQVMRDIKRKPGEGGVDNKDLKKIAEAENINIKKKTKNQIIQLLLDNKSKSFEKIINDRLSLLGDDLKIDDKKAAPIINGPLAPLANNNSNIDGKHSAPINTDAKSPDEIKKEKLERDKNKLKSLFDELGQIKTVLDIAVSKLDNQFEKKKLTDAEVIETKELEKTIIELESKNRKISDDIIKLRNDISQQEQSGSGKNQQTSMKEILQFGNGLIDVIKQQGGMYGPDSREEIPLPRMKIQPIPDYKRVIPFQFGSGKPLYTTDINKIMGRYKDYGGTIARDQIKLLLPNIKPQSRIAFVMNTDPSNKDGEHWISVYIDARPNGSNSVEYYDSYADPCPPDLLKGIKLIVDKMKPNTYLKFKENKVKMQGNTSNCGYFATRFLIDRFRNISFSEATGYDEKIKNAVKENEEEIEKLKKQAPFNYIDDLE